VSFIDDDFVGGSMGDGPECGRFIDDLVSAGMGIRFAIDCRVDDVISYPDLFERMKAAGLYKVFMGIESISATALDTYNKGYGRPEVVRAMAFLRSMDISVSPGFIPFDPYLTLEETAENLRFLVTECRCMDPGLITKELYPIKGTSLFSRLRRDSMLAGEYPVYQPKYRHDDVAVFRKELKSAIKDILSGFDLDDESAPAELSVQFLETVENVYRSLLKT